MGISIRILACGLAAAGFLGNSSGAGIADQVAFWLQQTGDPDFQPKVAAPDQQ